MSIAEIFLIFSVPRAEERDSDRANVFFISEAGGPDGGNPFHGLRSDKPRGKGGLEEVMVPPGAGTPVAFPIPGGPRHDYRSTA